VASWNEPAARAPYLAFRAGGGDYAVGILHVREIVSHERMTPIPATPSAVRGVLSVRGSAVSVVDLAVKVGLPPTKVTRHACVLVVEAGSAGTAPATGLLVDAVSEVIELGPADVEPPPVGPGGEVGFLIGMGKVGRRLVRLLDLERMLAAGGAGGETAPT
jgi:purine-binding chemotaxis protein CheW